MSKIVSIHGREILDSRGLPTVEAEVTLSSGITSRASVPSGASTGSKEALELRDGNQQRYFGKGVQKAVAHINKVIAPALSGQDPTQQQLIDDMMIELDASDNKGNLGANAILAVSLAVAKAAAKDQDLPVYRYLGGDGPFIMPVPLMNIINGGAHANNAIDIQEFMIVPVGAPTFAEALRYGVEVFHALKGLLQKTGYSTAVGDEGGFAPNLPSNQAALDIMMQAIEKSGFRAGKDICLALDVASSEFYDEGIYHLESENKHYNPEGLIDLYVNWVNNYPIISIEDGMAEEDWKGWASLTERLGNKIQLVGDDIFVTNVDLLRRGINENIANAILIKPNQIGTLTETLQTIWVAQEAKYATIISHRSGETEDVMIADLAVATVAGQIKTGSLCRTDRIAKYNQLLRIEEQLAGQAPYLGAKTFEIIHQDTDVLIQ